MKLTELDKTFFGEVRLAARLYRGSNKRKLVCELIEAHYTISQDAYIILKLEAALKEIEELSEGSPSSYRDFGDIARDALRLMSEARGGKPTPNLVHPSQSVLDILRLQNPERVRQDAEQPGNPKRQVVLDDGPNAGLVVAKCEYEYDAKLIVEIWNWVRTLTPNEKAHRSAPAADVERKERHE